MADIPDIDIWTWFGITDPSNDDLEAISEKEMVDCQEAAADLDAALAQFEKVAGNQKAVYDLRKQFTSAYVFLAQSQTALAARTPKNEDKPDAILANAYGQFVVMTDRFQTVCDNTTNEINSGVFAKRVLAVTDDLKQAAGEAALKTWDETMRFLSKAGQSTKDNLGKLVPDMPTWAIALLAIGGVAVISVAIAYSIRTVKG